MAEEPQDNSFTTGWKIAIIIAILGVMANVGVSALRERDEHRFRSHEKRIDDLENKSKELMEIKGKDAGLEL